MTNWRDLVGPASTVLKGLANAGGPVAGLIGSAGVDLVRFGIEAADQGLTREAIAQQLMDRTLDLIQQIKVGDES